MRKAIVVSEKQKTILTVIEENEFHEKYVL